MSSRYLSLLFVGFFCLIVLAACGQPQADATAVARAVEATLDAAAVPTTDTPPLTPVPSTALPTSTDSPVPATATLTPAPSPTASVTLAPSPTYSPTPVSVVIPFSWKEYSDPTGAFTMLYPPEWEVSGQNVNKVVFAFKPYGVASIELIEVEGTDQAKIGDPAAIDATARYAIEDQKGGDVVKNVEKGVWPFTPTGHFALLDIIIAATGLPAERLYLASPLGSSHGVMAQMIQVNGRVTDADRETLSKVIAAVRPSAWGAEGGPIAVVRPTATPPGTPQVVANKAVNLRAGPGTNYPVLGAAQPGSQYNITGRNQDGSWLEVCCVNDKPAWVSKSVVTTGGDLTGVLLASSIPPTPVPPTPGPTVQVAEKSSEEWATKAMPDCGATYSYPSTWSSSNGSTYNDEANKGLIIIWCADISEAGPMTSQEQAQAIANVFGADAGIGGYVAEEFISGEGVQFPFVLATFSMVIKDVVPGETLVASIPVSPDHAIMVVAIAAPGFSDTFRWNLMNLVYKVVGS